MAIIQIRYPNCQNLLSLPLPCHRSCASTLDFLGGYRHAGEVCRTSSTRSFRITPFEQAVYLRLWKRTHADDKM